MTGSRLRNSTKWPAVRFSIKSKLLQIKLEIKRFYIFKEQANNSETVVLCENQFVVYATGTSYCSIFM